MQYLVAVLSVVLATLGALPVYPSAADFPALLLLAAVAISASFGGYGPAVVAVVGGFVALDFFFEMPRYTLEVTALGTSIDLVAFVLVAMLLGTLNARLRGAHDRASAARKQAEAALQARDEALAIVSHDLRTPLTAIKTSISTLRNPGAPLADGTALELLGTIEAEADRLVHFVSDALAMTRLEAGIAPDRQWNALGEIVSAVLDRVSPVLGDRPTTFDVPDTLPLARLDAGERRRPWNPAGGARSGVRKIPAPQRRRLRYGPGSGYRARRDRGARRTPVGRGQSTRWGPVHYACAHCGGS
jgi:K+-sensing histidine kinase KdpD